VSGWLWIAVWLAAVALWLAWEWRRPNARAAKRCRVAPDPIDREALDALTDDDRAWLDAMGWKAPDPADRIGEWQDYWDALNGAKDARALMVGMGMASPDEYRTWMTTETIGGPRRRPSGTEWLPR
jgi:hypothetical protein